MEIVRDYMECLNTHWLAMVTAGMYTHIREICIIGLCFEETHGPVFHPTYASLLFTFSVLSLLAEYKPWPRSLKEPPTTLLYIYEMLVATLVTNLSTRGIWVPLLTVLWNLTQESSKWLMWVNSSTGLDTLPFVNDFAGFMANEDATLCMAWCLSFMSFLWMLDATESLDAILDYVSSKTKSSVFLVMRKSPRSKRISFEDPEITNWMVKILCTIWALMLQATKVYIFQTCCVNSVEDDLELFITISPIPALLFATGVYIMVAQATLLPRSFQKPIAPILCTYELLSTIFILEFSVGCIWSPLNVLILSTLPKAISHALHTIDEHGAACWIDMNGHTLMTVLIYILSVGFLGIALHVSTALDFSIFTEHGIIVFLDCAIYRLWQRLLRELPKFDTSLSECAAIANKRKPPRKPRKRREPFRECFCPEI